MASIGHNQPSFDQVVEENLRRGLLLTQRDALIRCIEDPRLQPRHQLVLAKIIKRTNQKTATAFPGRRTLTKDSEIMAGGVRDPEGPYSEQVVANTISELMAFGYLVHDRRAPNGGGRALSHYALATPSIEDVELEVKSYLQAIEARTPRLRPDVTIRSDVRLANVTLRSDVTTEGDVSGEAAQSSDKSRQIPDVTTVSDVTTGVGTVTSKKDNTPSLAAGADDEPPTRKRAGKPKTILLEGWKPAPETVAWAKANFIASDAQIANEAEKFYEYHYGRGNKMADWPAAWRTWWLNGFHKIPRRTRPTSVGPTTDHGREMTDAFERARLADEAERCRR